jgi:uncharacterized membrane protein YhaH (DUF805 family)
MILVLLQPDSSAEPSITKFLVIKHKEKSVPQSILEKYPEEGPVDTAYGNYSFKSMLPRLVICLLLLMLGAFLTIKGHRMIHDNRKSGWLLLIFGVALWVIGLIQFFFYLMLAVFVG